MDAPTVELHEKLIRLAKGMVSAWEEWVKKQKTAETPYRSTL
jgi:hypothetical protein